MVWVLVTFAGFVSCGCSRRKDTKDKIKVAKLQSWNFRIPGIPGSPDLQDLDIFHTFCFTHCTDCMYTSGIFSRYSLSTYRTYLIKLGTLYLIRYFLESVHCKRLQLYLVHCTEIVLTWYIIYQVSYVSPVFRTAVSRQVYRPNYLIHLAYKLG